MSRARTQKRGKEQRPPPRDRVIGITVDREKRLVTTYTDDMLINQLKRNSAQIAASFDRLCDGHLREISELSSIVLMLVHRGVEKASQENDQVRMTCLQMLTNAMNTFMAATTILRYGYRLQPGILVRNILETISTVLHLYINPDDLADFQEGCLQSSKTIPAAKKVLPPFGGLYGFFSEEFAHLGTLHQSLQPLISYSTFDDSLKMNVSFLRLASWLLYVTTELVCHEIVNPPRYWQYLGKNEQDHMFAYNPSDKERQWQARYLGIIGMLNDS